MGFSAPLFLLGLLALMIPFLLLFTKASSSRITQFSSVEFLRTITEHASRTMEWKRLLLLAVRLLALLALAAAFALPFTSRTCRLSLWAAGPAKHVVLILDTSLSMSAVSGEVPIFSLARERARAVIRENGSGAAFSIYTFNTRVQAAAEEEREASKAGDRLADLKTSEAAGDFEALAGFLEKKFGQTPPLPEEIWIFSDFSITGGALKRLEDYQARADGVCTLHWVPVRAENFRNFRPHEILLPPRPLLKQTRESLSVSFESWGYAAGTEIKLDLWIEDVKTASGTALIGPSGRGTVVFEHTFPSAGRYAVRVESPDDSLNGDNRLYALLDVRQPLDLLVVESGVYPYPFENPYYYVSQALESFAGASSGNAWVNMARIPAEGLRDLRLADYDIVAAADQAGLEIRDLAQLKKYLEEGGRVLFALGPTFSESAGSEGLQNFLGGRLDAPRTAAGDAGSFFLGGVDYRHPILEVFDQSRQGDLTRIPFRTLMPFTPEASASSSVVLWFESRWPALVETRTGRGKLFVWTTSLNHAWTAFPKDPLYVPFVFELLKYAVLGPADRGALLKPGSLLRFEAADGPPFDQVLVRTPRGEQVTIYGREGSAPLPYSVETSGLFEWIGLRGREMERHLAVSNADPEESKPPVVPVESLSVRETPVSGSASAPAPASAERRFFYRPLLYALTLLLFLEAWLANRFYKPRWV